uniref:Uncharacterized protein n=1 Tax=Triticum urartu TaxID=4572 RepID=A0A8R7U3P9_TRIUA
MPPFLTLNHEPHLGLHLACFHKTCHVSLQLHSDAHALCHRHLVHPLLSFQRQTQHRHPSHNGLQYRVPSAVCHERVGCPSMDGREDMEGDGWVGGAMRSMAVVPESGNLKGGSTSTMVTS